MAKMGRPKVDNPINHMVTAKFREEEYQLMLEYAENGELRDANSRLFFRPLSH